MKRAISGLSGDLKIHVPFSEQGEVVASSKYGYDNARRGNEHFVIIQRTETGSGFFEWNGVRRTAGPGLLSPGRSGDEKWLPLRTQCRRFSLPHRLDTGVGNSRPAEFRSRGRAGHCSPTPLPGTAFDQIAGYRARTFARTPHPPLRRTFFLWPLVLPAGDPHQGGSDAHGTHQSDGVGNCPPMWISLTACTHAGALREPDRRLAEPR